VRLESVGHRVLPSTRLSNTSAGSDDNGKKGELFQRQSHGLQV
jgi:hypothetical protein